MRHVVTVGLAIGIGLLVYAVWAFNRTLSTPVPFRDVDDREAAAQSDLAANAAGVGRMPFDPVKHLADWRPEGTKALPVDRPLGKNIPRQIGEIEVMCRGKDVVGANTLELKRVIQSLITMPLTDDEKKAIADYFRNLDDPTTKYFLLVAFRYIGDDFFSEAVEEYYDLDKAAVAESLSWIITRSPKAAQAFERILEREVEPLRREDMIARAGLQKSLHAEKLLLDVYRNPKSPVDQRSALMSLARIHSEEGRTIVRDVLNGEFTSAGYDDAGDPPLDPSMRDLRAHAVVGLAVHGDVEDARFLIERYRHANANDPIAKYIAQYVGACQTPELVPQVVETILEKGGFPPITSGPDNHSFFIFLDRQARPEHLGQLTRLFQVARSDIERRRIQEIMDRLN